MNYMLMPLKRYSDFSGRSRRKEFWLWTLLNIIVVGVLTGILVWLVMAAAWRTGEKGGIQRVDPYNSSAPVRTDTVPPVQPGEIDTPDSIDVNVSPNTADPDTQELETFDVPEEEVNFSAYSTSYSVEYQMDPKIFFRELGTGGWIAFGLLMVWALITFIPTLAVSIRRLHDQDKSGWFYLINFVPFVGGIIMIVFYLLEGTRGPNRFGPDPKAGYDPHAFN